MHSTCLFDLSRFTSPKNSQNSWKNQETATHFLTRDNYLLIQLFFSHTKCIKVNGFFFLWCLFCIGDFFCRKSMPGNCSSPIACSDGRIWGVSAKNLQISRKIHKMAKNLWNATSVHYFYAGEFSQWFCEFIRLRQIAGIRYKFPPRK